MYGTVARIKVKPGKLDDLQSAMQPGSEDAPGAVGIFVYQMDVDPSELYMVAVFESKEAYFANAERPETNANYEKILEFVESEPEWHDGEIIYSELYS